MFFDAYPHIFSQNAKFLRANITPEELLLWEHLKNKKLGVRFKPQQPMMHYIVDFYSYALKLIIELDGPIHNFSQQEDHDRTKAVEDAGNTVFRFSNEDVINNLEYVLNKLSEVISHRNRKCFHLHFTFT